MREEPEQDIYEVIAHGLAGKLREELGPEGFEVAVSRVPLAAQPAQERWAISVESHGPCAYRCSLVVHDRAIVADGTAHLPLSDPLLDERVLEFIRKGWGRESAGQGP